MADVAEKQSMPTPATRRAAPHRCLAVPACEDAPRILTCGPDHNRAAAFIDLADACCTKARQFLECGNIRCSTWCLDNVARCLKRAREEMRTSEPHSLCA
ncbi:MAG: hypothetical protein ACUVSF_13135 [Anaerolineae bacterium]